MKARLNALEKRAVDDLLAWDRTRRRADMFAGYVSLVLGGVIVIAVTAYTLDHLDDQTAYTVSRVGFLSAIVFFLVFAFVSHRARERHQLATILRKLTGRT